MHYEYVGAIGQDSHRFQKKMAASPAPLMLGGTAIPDHAPFDANSDGDVLLHALCNAISGISGKNILGEVTDRLCLTDKITDSAAYLNVALGTLGAWELTHISFSVEGKTPHLAEHVDAIRASVASLVGLDKSQIGLTATSGEALTAVGRGEGLIAFCHVTARRQAV